jgi:hypothetical protein
MAGRLENKVALVLVLPVLAPISGGIRETYADAP